MLYQKPLRMIRIRIHGLVVLMLMSVFSLAAQDYNSTPESKRLKRQLAKLEKKEAYNNRVVTNSEELLMMIEQGDLVIMGDGHRTSRRYEPTASDFFRITGDTLTLQKMTSVKGDVGLFGRITKKKGLIAEVKVWEYKKGQPRRVSFGYTDLLTSEYYKISIFVHANRFELYDDFALRKLIRGKLTTNQEAGFEEIGRSSIKLLLNGR